MQSVERYVELQKGRLEQIRQATEKEKQLLRTHHTHRAASTSNASEHRDEPFRSPIHGDSGSHSSAVDAWSNANIASFHNTGRGGGGIVAAAELAGRSLLESLAAVGVPNSQHSHFSSEPPTRIAASHFQERAAELQIADEALRREDSDLTAQESNIERRLEKVNQLKKELLSALVTLQYREKEQKEIEAMLDAEVYERTKRQDELRERQREIQHQKTVQGTELAARDATLAAAKKKLYDKGVEQQKASQRMKQQTIELEDRVRGLELQLSTKQRTVDDMERDLARDDMRQRDEELQAVNDLRQDLERRQLSLKHSSRQ